MRPHTHVCGHTLGCAAIHSGVRPHTHVYGHTLGCAATHSYVWPHTHFDGVFGLFATLNLKPTHP